MSGSFKRKMIGLIALFKQIVEGTTDFRRTATGGTSTTVVDSSLSSSSDYNDVYNGYTVRFRDNTTTTALRGKSYTVTDYAGATGTFTFAALDDTPVSGDTFDVYLQVRAEQPSLTTAPEDIESNVETLTYERTSAQKGLEGCSISFAVELAGLETTRTKAQGSTDALDAIDQLLKGVLGTRTVGEGTQVSGGSSTTTQIDVDDASVFAVGDLVMINNQVRRVTAVDTGSTPDNITVHKALSAAPADNDEVYAAVSYKSVEDGHDAWQVLVLMDDQLAILNGVRFNVKGSAEFGNAVMLNLEGQGSSYEYADSFAMAQKLPTGRKIPVKAGACDFGGTALGVQSFEFDFGHTVEVVKDTEAHVAKVVDRVSTGKAKFRNTIKTAKETWELTGTIAQMLIQAGNAAGAACAVDARAQFKSITHGDAFNIHYLEGEFQQRDDHTDPNTSEKMVLARF